MPKRNMTVDEKIERLTNVVGRHDGVLDRHASRMDRLEAGLELQKVNIDRLSQVVNTLASSSLDHDARIEALVTSAERHERIWQRLEKRWQAYWNTLPKN